MPTDLPQNAGYMIAAYIVTGVIVVGYAIALLVQARRARTD